ncbi:cucumisin-like [Castanea sativa]|uniref:cucumisin-like n=1 Tax=Castanea sativa TaxID=21020 RepID=UPI003F653B42
MGDLPKGEISASSIHTSILQEVIGSYTKSFNGFVAKLTKEEEQKLAGMEGIVSVFPNEKKLLHTTRSWDFMGFPKTVKRKTFESEVIIKMIDIGIWLESESFNNEGFGPHPKRWKGICQESSHFTYNNKIIGARYYHSGRKLGASEFASPRDSEGHGSHTASIAAGNVVSGASLLGLGTGTTRGGVPSARIAVYKICWSDGCFAADILATFDDAINDGVDIISLSVGGFSPLDYFKDSIAIGAFHAMRNGILTSTFVGNSGPSLATITNFSPWSLSMAASTIDRKFVAKVKLGNGELYEVLIINCRLCLIDSLDKKLVKGKIVLCDEITDGEGTLGAGAVGTIMQGVDFGDVAFSFPLPASCLSLKEGSKVKNYYESSSLSHECQHEHRCRVCLRGKSYQSYRAINPSLVYDAEEVDYVNFLCGQGYSSKSLRLVTGDNSSCSQATKISAWNLNHPSFTLSSRPKSVITRFFTRTVTNVKSPVSTYKAIVNAPTGLKIEVIPNVLSFESFGQK